MNKIEVSLAEATTGFACNLVSTGETVIMSAHAPEFQANIEAHGLHTITPDVTELGKGGGYIRCTTLTLDNL
jgi:N-dimethylarginine dimethylaminohydrolase